ncbi:hypothetical protein [Microbacterium paludicola]|uniref:hypothetical protein n=1 Tax=Microbacterium paludicola TaxID=300019 RepID=UPI0031E07624
MNVLIKFVGYLLLALLLVILSPVALAIGVYRAVRAHRAGTPVGSTNVGLIVLGVIGSAILVTSLLRRTAAYRTRLPSR